MDWIKFFILMGVLTLGPGVRAADGPLTQATPVKKQMKKAKLENKATPTGYEAPKTSDGGTSRDKNKSSVQTAQGEKKNVVNPADRDDTEPDYDFTDPDD